MEGAEGVVGEDGVRGTGELEMVLVPAEQQRIVEILVEQVVVYPDRIEVALAADGLYSIVGEMRQQEGCDAE